ncbi:hypothetical protein B7C51_25085 (plasmid) [Paenibacillus larvae subsp. pulvifaciens]|uniref:Uncharacterized protein n=1 Tax=Paenibacillus larvae subsp. pulvifaciens TaxID=1477 RepID=A0A1V0V021_9BACL|nr:ParM/StbA family protein [Paenibacillus larvae]ARF70749.1 hypothetical protein B7C51_25085 [Paenibacillus larvae subsp. pulvifaciens]
MAKNESVVWSIDDGYGDVKACNGVVNGVVEEGENLNTWEYFQRTGNLLIPSYVTLWRDRPDKELKEGEKVDPLSYIYVEYEGVEYLVGQGAVEQDTKGSWVGGKNKHADIDFPVILATTLGLLAKQEKEMVDCLVMGLPVENEEEEDRRLLLEKLVLGDGKPKFHEVRIVLADGTELERSICVNHLEIKKQPFGSLCSVILDNEGEISNATVASGFNIISDIGARTLNVYTLSALEPIRDYCFQTNDGMFSAYEEIGTFIQKKTGDHVPDIKLPKIIERGRVGDLDITPYKESIYKRHANKIVNILEKRFVNAWPQVNRIIYTGGGGELLKNKIISTYDMLLNKKEMIFLNRFSTAEGLQRHGKRIVKRKKSKSKVGTATE